jgi:hypothetical protein
MESYAYSLDRNNIVSGYKTEASDCGDSLDIID